MRLRVDTCHRAAYIHVHMYFDKINCHDQLPWLYLALVHMVQLQRYMYMYVYGATKQPSNQVTIVHMMHSITSQAAAIHVSTYVYTSYKCDHHA